MPGECAELEARKTLCALAQTPGMLRTRAPFAVPQIHYEAFLADKRATLFDSTLRRGRPLCFTCGHGMMIRGR